MLHHGPATLLEHDVSSLALVEGDLTLAALKTGLGISSETEVLSLGKDGNRLTRVVAEAVTSSLAEDAAPTFAVWAGAWLYGDTDATRNDRVGATLFKIATGTATIGTKTGIDGAAPVDDTYTFADAITLTQAEYHVDLQSALGSAAPKAHSPGSNSVARIVIDELGAADFVAIESTTGLHWRARAMV